jgi:hypothetical protein
VDTEAFKAIRKIGDTGRTSAANTLAVQMDCGASVICKDEQAQQPSSEPFCRTRNSQHFCEFCHRTQGGHSQFEKPAPTIVGAGVPS